MQNDHQNSNMKKCETIIESLYKEFSLRHEKELENQKASISESYNAKNSFYSGAHIMAIVKSEIDYIQRLMDHLLEKIEADFPNIPLKDFQKKLGAIVSQEYDRAIPVLEKFAKGISRGSNVGHYIKQVTDAKKNNLEILDARCKLRQVKKTINKPSVFISHAAEDAVLAEIVKNQIDNVFETKINVFVSSIPGTISPGSDWFNKIVRNLTENNAFVVLVTPYSENRPFVWFEIGFSWFRRLNKNCEIYAICAPPINPGNLSEPLCRLQAISLGEEKQIKAFFTELIKQFSLGNLDALEFAKIRDSLPTYPSQITQTENIDISDEAKELLIEASKDKSGYILKYRSSKGATIQTNNKNIVPSQKARIVAKWESAFNELVENDFIEERGVKGESFQVTHTGYEYADTLKNDAWVLQDKPSAGTSASAHQDDLEFEKDSGTYISKEDGNRYCPKCLHSSSQRVPLKEQKNGWLCNVCDTFYPNPNYNPPTHSRNKRHPMRF